MSHLFCFGLGYSAGRLAERLRAAGWAISGTAARAESVQRARSMGFQCYLLNDEHADDAIPAALASATHLLASIPPGPEGDPALMRYASDAASAPSLGWVGYLSTVGVYGDRNGDWVDETSPPRPQSQRSIRRLAAEQAWRELARAAGRTVMVFRLAGIYGPGRSAIEAVREGKARRIVKPGQVFNRIHVDDVARALETALSGRGTQDTYNVADDEPAPPQDVIAYAASLLGMPLPPALAIEDADLSAMSASFFAENKRVSNRRMKEDLGLTLAYPTYREGLAAILAEAEAEGAAS
jgi:nucleoside-diphosphate-sugar epimerase